MESEQAPRSKCRHVGKWANCECCGVRFASFPNKNGWIKVCSRKCSNDLLKAHQPPKVHKTRMLRIRNTCASCGKNLTNPVGKDCRKCYLNRMDQELDVRMRATTLADVREHSQGYKSRHAYQKIRNHADRVIVKAGVARLCRKCNGVNGLEVCHVKGIATFDSTTTISVINDLGNLVYLCPTHHWEMDHGLLVMQV